MSFNILDIVQRHNYEMNFSFRRLANTIIKNSELDITLLRINNVTEDSFCVSIDVRITKTGLISACMSPMTVDLCGPFGQWGELELPAIRTEHSGVEVTVARQLVTIVDKEALKDFIQTLIGDWSVILTLCNGHTSISAMRWGPRDVVFEKEVEVTGMQGPVVRLQAATVNLEELGDITPKNPPQILSVVVRVQNPSPLEISFGTCSFDIRLHDGEKLAEVKGRLDIRRGNFEFRAQGRMDLRVAAKLLTKRLDGFVDEDKPVHDVRLVGRRCASVGWCDDTIKSINVPLDDTALLARIIEMETEWGPGGPVVLPRQRG
ncbi:hypothetical protein F4777DRAFT_574853 [Nemania sp. FL0916]|nr:hypothetical protein F4777DRAFT_574853 [Nemania sp. FL0916]